MATTRKQKVARARVAIFAGQSDETIAKTTGLEVRQVKTQRAILRDKNFDLSAQQLTVPQAALLLCSGERAVRRSLGKTISRDSLVDFVQLTEPY